MSEVIAQIFILIAYLAIALMSVTVPTYAIAISYLARESSKSMEDLKKRRKDLAEKLDQLKKELEEKPGVEAIEGEIRKYKEEETELKNRLFSLSARGAVGLPFVFFMTALVLASYSIHTNIADSSLLFTAMASIGFGLVFLANTLVAIERAALRPEEALLPAFRVAFKSGATVERFKRGEQKEITIVVTNYGKETAENTQVAFFFPPEFDVSPKRDYTIVKQESAFTDYPGYNATFFDVPIFHIDVSLLLAVLIKMPDKLGRYDIPVSIKAKRIGKSEHTVRVEIA